MRKPQEFGLSAARQGIAEIAQALQQEVQFAARMAIAARPVTWACCGRRNCGRVMLQVDVSGKLERRGLKVRLNEVRKCPSTHWWR